MVNNNLVIESIQWAKMLKTQTVNPFIVDFPIKNCDVP